MTPSRPTPSTPTATRRGSIYLVTLITVGAIATTVLIGVKLRAADSTQSAFIEEMAKNNNAVLSGTELAIQKIADDPVWPSTAQTGIIFKGITSESNTYTATVTDAETSAKPDGTTTKYRVKVIAQANLARSAAQIDINAAKYDYLQLLDDLDAQFYWPLNDPENSSDADDPLDANDGTYRSLSTASSGTNDEGAPVATFSATSDHVEVPWDNKFKQSKGSIAMWIKYTGPSNSAIISPFVGMRYQSGGNPTLNMAVIFNTLVVYVDDAGTYDYGHMLTSGVGDIVPDQWFHIAMTWSNSSGLAIYVNGTEVASNASITEGVDTASIFSGGRQPLVIGAGYNMYSAGTPLAGFKGSMSHVVYFDPRLSASDVAKLSSIKPDEITLSIIQDSWQVLVNE